jgi:hypothetical protein
VLNKHYVLQFPEQIACRISRLSLLSLPVEPSSGTSRGNVMTEAVPSYDRQFEVSILMHFQSWLIYLTTAALFA